MEMFGLITPADATEATNSEVASAAPEIGTKRGMGMCLSVGCQSYDPAARVARREGCPFARWAKTGSGSGGGRTPGGAGGKDRCGRDLGRRRRDLRDRGRLRPDMGLGHVRDRASVQGGAGRAGLADGAPAVAAGIMEVMPEVAKRTQAHHAQQGGRG